MASPSVDQGRCSGEACVPGVEPRGGQLQWWGDRAAEGCTRMTLETLQISTPPIWRVHWGPPTIFK